MSDRTRTPQTDHLRGETVRMRGGLQFTLAPPGTSSTATPRGGMECDGSRYRDGDMPGSDALPGVDGGAEEAKAR